jgi:hypothetical protein
MSSRQFKPVIVYQPTSRSTHLLGKIREAVKTFSIDELDDFRNNGQRISKFSRLGWERRMNCLPFQVENIFRGSDKVRS